MNANAVATAVIYIYVMNVNLVVKVATNFYVIDVKIVVIDELVILLISSL